MRPLIIEVIKGPDKGLRYIAILQNRDIYYIECPWGAGQIQKTDCKVIGIK